MSDNAAAVCPEVIAAIQPALAAAATAYDSDAWSQRLDGVFGTFFGAPCTVFTVSSGTVANALTLAAMVPPFGAIVCHEEAHIHVDECGAPEFYTGGAKLLLVRGDHGKLTPDGIRSGLAAHRGDVHQVQPRALSVTQSTECGTIYTPDELAALSDYAKAQGWRVHMDGARFANALATLGCHPGDLSWRVGVDALSFGMIKNGGMSAEAIVLFDQGLADDLRFRRKRAGQMPSKGRLNAAQLIAMIESGAVLRNAQAANAAAKQLADAAAGRLLHPVQGNEVFVQLQPGEAERLRSSGFGFYDWGALDSNEARFVAPWDAQAADISALAQALAHG